MKKLMGLSLMVTILLVGAISFADTTVATEDTTTEARYGYGRQDDGVRHHAVGEMTEEERALHLEEKVAYLDKLLADGKITQDQYNTFKTATETCTGDPSACTNELRLRDFVEPGQGFGGGSNGSGHRGGGQGQGRRHQ